jgi:hypothetical protein
MPQITSADTNLINEKFVFWINCWKNVKSRRRIRVFIWVNLRSKDGKYRDWMKLEERDFEYCSTPMYNAATKKWSSEHTDVRNLEDFKKRQLKVILAKERKQANQRIRDVLDYKFLTIAEKGYVLLDMDNSNIKVESLLKRYLKKKGREGKLTKEEKGLNINKGYIYDLVSDMDLDPELIMVTTNKILRDLKARERET